MRSARDFPERGESWSWSRMAGCVGIVGAQPEWLRHSDSKLEGFGGEEAADYSGGIALVGIDLGVEATHLFFGDFVA